MVCDALLHCDIVMYVVGDVRGVSCMWRVYYPAHTNVSLGLQHHLGLHISGTRGITYHLSPSLAVSLTIYHLA